MVVEEDVQVPQAIRWALRDDRVAVLAAATGREALGPRVERVPDLVELDITLLKVNGYVVAGSLRRTRPADPDRRPRVGT